MHGLARIVIAAGAIVSGRGDVCRRGVGDGVDVNPTDVGRRARALSVRAPASNSSDRLVLVAALTAGALFRLLPYLERPSLSLDEARLALNIGARSFAGLLLPLAYDQAAPPVFLWAEKTAMLIGGPNEYSLRALPLVAGLLVPALTYVLAVRTAGKRIARLATALTALSPSLVQYSIQLKPYSMDALACVGLLATFVLESGRRPDRGPGPWTTALGTIAVWLSVTAPFVLAAVGMASWRAARGCGRRLAAALGSWGVSFGIVYWAVYRPTAGNPYLNWYWSQRLLTAWIPGLPSRAFWAIRDVLFTSFVSDVFEVRAIPFHVAAVLVAVTVIGVLAWLGWRRLALTGSTGPLLLGGPLAGVFAASLLGAYPIGARVVLFAVPLWMIFVAAGVVRVVSLPPLGRRVTVAVLLSPILAAGQLRNVVRADDPYREGHLRPAVEFIEREATPSEPVYVAAGALPSWTFYTTDWSRPDTARLARMAREGSSGGRAFENGPPRGRRVLEDNEDLVFPLRGRVELLGVADGAPFRAGDPLKQPSDPGWATSEARRIRRVAQPTAWLAATESYGLSDQLDGALRSLGGVRRDSLVGHWVVAARYQFP